MSRVLNDPVVEPQFPDNPDGDFEDLTDDQKAAFVAMNSSVHRVGMAKSYLASTDWYVSRKSETGTAIPENISALRAQARIDASE